jgi:hypothetical protein
MAGLVFGAAKPAAAKPSGETSVAHKDVVAERESSTLIGPDQLTGDTTGADVAYVLGHIRFRNGLQTIALDRDARNYLLACVLARIGGRVR